MPRFQPNLEKFKQINGFDNEYWGWGAEDDDLGFRCTSNNIQIKRKMGNIFFSTPHDIVSKDDHNNNLKISKILTREVNL